MACIMRKSKESIAKEIGHRIQVERRKQGFSQEQLALMAGLDRTYVGGIERGERNVTVINIIRLTTILKIEPGQILDGLRAAPKEER